MHDIQNAPFQGVGSHIQITVHVELSKIENRQKSSETKKWKHKKSS